MSLESFFQDLSDESISIAFKQLLFFCHIPTMIFMYRVLVLRYNMIMLKNKTKNSISVDLH